MEASMGYLGRYELRTQLRNRNGLETWQAFDTQLQRLVAIRLLRFDHQTDPNYMKHFEREARLLASLHHPNIVQIHEFQIAPVTNFDASAASIAYMVMDYIEGLTLADYIQRTSHVGKFPPVSDLIQLVASMSVALDYAHQRGVVHGDIRPTAILLDRHTTLRNRMGEPMLAEFGTTQLLGKSSTLIQSNGNAAELPLYAAPEQVQGQPADKRSDLYALGVILYELCAGVTPFQGNNAATIMLQHINDQPPLPTRFHPGIPPALVQVIMRSLAKKPEERFSSATTMAIAVAEALGMAVPDILDTSSEADPTQAQTLINKAGSNYLQPAPVTPFLGLSTLDVIHSPSSPIQAQGSLIRQSTAPLSSPENGATLVEIASKPSSGASLYNVAHSVQKEKKSRKWWLIGVCILLILVLGSSGVWTFFTFFHKPLAVAKPPSIVGHAFFVSSGQLNNSSSQGINDEVQIDMYNISPPVSGNSYYVWLLSDKQKSPTVSLQLGTLTVSHGTVHFLYQGDQKHSNLIAVFSRLLIEERSTGSVPASPSSEQHMWRYTAEIPQIPSPTGRHNRAIDNLRDILYEGPRLLAIGIHGGTDSNIFRGVQKILEWAGSARDDWTTQSTDSMHRHFVRILDYLDGAPFVAQDVPAKTPLLVNPTIASIPLLDVSAKQNPSSYIDRLNDQLGGLIHAPGLTSEKHQLAIQTDTAVLKNLPLWLGKVHQDAKQLVKMDTAELLKPATLSLIDDMLSQSLFAFIGQLNPDTGQVQAGVVQVHYNIQRLATLDIKPV